MSFESAKEQNTAAQPGKQRNPVGNFTNMDWDKEAMKAEVTGYPDATVVNWSELARRYYIKNRNGDPAKNGGQIAEEWLKSVGVDVKRFKRVQSNAGGRVRRKKLRGAGGEITVATPQTNANMKDDLKKKVMSGEYAVGQLITPKKVKLIFSSLFSGLL